MNLERKVQGTRRQVNRTLNIHITSKTEIVCTISRYIMSIQHDMSEGNTMHPKYDMSEGKTVHHWPPVSP